MKKSNILSIFCHKYWGELSWGELSIGQVVHGASCHWASCPWGELSMGQVAHGASCPWGELSLGRDVLGRVLMMRVVYGASCLGASGPGTTITAQAMSASHLSEAMRGRGHYGEPVPSPILPYGALGGVGHLRRL